MQRTILCYGDSNTWGYVPSADSGKGIERYSRSMRWTGVLQDLLGDDYYIIEEGLNGRTTNIDYQIPPDRNGKTYLPPCLYTHAPIDLVVLAIGGNDFKTYFNRDAKDVCNGMAELIDIIQTSKYGESMQSSPKILIISPSILLPVAEKFVDEKGICYLKGAGKKAESLVKYYEQLSKNKKCHFLDISKTITPSNVDGIHFDAVTHKQLAQLIFNKIKDII